MTMENPHLRTIVDQDGAAILDIERGVVSTLNLTGAYVLQGLLRGESLETIIANLAAETGEEVPLVDLDVREFVADFRRKHSLPQ